MEMDSDNDNDNDNDTENEVDFTGFLFGNIDSEGKLVDDIFDNESKKHLSSLARLGRITFDKIFQKSPDLNIFIF